MWTLQIYDISDVSPAWANDYYTDCSAVKDKDLSTPPSTPATGDRYIVATGCSGDWAGLSTCIVEWSGSAWTHVHPSDGYACFVTDENDVRTKPKFKKQSHKYSKRGATWTRSQKQIEINPLE